MATVDNNVVATDAVSKAIAQMIKANGAKFFGVTFVKKNGEERTLNGHMRKVEGHGGHNNASHYEKYVTIVLNEKDENGKEQWRNVNLETIVSLKIGGRSITFK
ncbi:hypothetical protein vB_PsyM_KIL3b_0150 [Pseudomonas phage vB_PsyM_KIL3b]|uniref:Uncharacterized protein n=6 Tax=Flaumdravirus TaxID=2560133 RepID=A0A142IF79_9CAUD|nr:hypothetical protein BH774_gp053 [Pseudomonas phage vB_PsyM_KIL1]YP_009616837.1 hypothetical protein FDI83_gp053 [Pseudomonas phage vB_PsyM_KIL4]AMR57557.1 hypothetical protein vB_PsyM_KIL2_0157 [Pseudomonas phage vB_PsyM_KIL2]AMR57717.1 hypothetical protein vB_PsyM_KIL3_0150 [Pseudomonas phage vB_PsyM_KIL3]AMR58053.1 hypothetical protein vB_PsyM_KIL5_0162 [Pseudomonas phage vB_PsyM_KIL5]AMR58215.1 hypothetical protein vB_PsyM_KIL3b_0150 [Pseudomonas phage vB_PsyM_KIL3b]AMR57396.1 hypothet